MGVEMGAFAEFLEANKIKVAYCDGGEIYHVDTGRWGGPSYTGVVAELSYTDCGCKVAVYSMPNMEFGNVERVFSRVFGDDPVGSGREFMYFHLFYGFTAPVRPYPEPHFHGSCTGQRRTRLDFYAGE